MARALAVMGMILVNFKIVLGNEGSSLLKAVTGFFDGKAAATFVVLAGTGIMLMLKAKVEKQAADAIGEVRGILLKRALFLFITGLSYIVIWPADILHFYAFYLVAGVIFLKASKKVIFVSAGILILGYLLLMGILDYKAGWNFTTLEYLDLWTADGFVRNLFYNGFHPVIPWTAFLLIGMWLGKLDLRDRKLLRKVVFLSFSLFMLIQLVSAELISFFSGEASINQEDVRALFGTSPMPPLPFYMISGASFAVFLISLCILISEKFRSAAPIQWLEKTGKMALTLYVLHVVFGMGLIYLVKPGLAGKFTLKFSVSYTLLFSLLSVMFSVLWLKKFRTGPLEWLMRRITG